MNCRRIIELQFFTKVRRVSCCAGHDILFFWVARMVMLSLELIDKLPFRTVFLHPMVRDSQGQKMSKSKGNVVDPLEVINGISLDGLIAKLHTGNLQQKEINRSEQMLRTEFKDGIPACGCDALRLGLVAYMRQGRNINLDLNRVVGYRQFANKIWNCTKFALDKWALDVDGRGTPFVSRGIQMLAPPDEHKASKLTSFSELRWEDQWILHRLSMACEQVHKPSIGTLAAVLLKTLEVLNLCLHQFTAAIVTGRFALYCWYKGCWFISQANKCFECFEFGDVVSAIYNFWLYELCDFYLEAIKPRVQAFTRVEGEKVEAEQARVRDARRAQEVLYTCIDRGLRLLHPICPFVTEELYQRLPPSEVKAESICISSYPLPVVAWTNCVLDVRTLKTLKPPLYIFSPYDYADAMWVLS